MGFMKLLKKIPIRFKGELHDVRLINFSVPIGELKTHIPKQIKIREFDGRAVISMVDVKLVNMRPSLLSFFKFNYRHVAFRVLVEDSHLNDDGVNKGIYFFRAFTDKSLMIAGGRALTDYNLEKASIIEGDSETTISTANNYVKYAIGNKAAAGEEELIKMIGSLDRAYSMLDDKMRVTIIQREKWPIQAVECTKFENTFFTSAKLLGAFRIFETIYYDWLPPTVVK
jgi:hypothetical protein